ncbi:MAG: hypothetical protein QXS20_04490 [Candidatus Thorarchaeota archaeon]
MLNVEDPRIRTLLELRKELEDELDQLRERSERIEAFIQALDEMIGSRSFATADTVLPEKSSPTVPSQPPVTATVSEPRKIELLNKTRDLLLATLEVTDTEIKVVPAPHASYDIKRGAFARFFVERVLGQYQQEDRRRVENDEIEWEDAFDFEIKADDGTLVSILIRNYGGSTRLNEIQRTLRWALEKTYRER